MTWTMNSVSYRMSGSGSWQNLLPDQSSRRQYSDIYPKGALLPTRSGLLLKLFSVWKQAAIVRFENKQVIPLGPIMTDSDLTILQPWFQDISSFMGQAVLERLNDYRAMAQTLAGNQTSVKQAVDNLLSILICALTLDSWVFTQLRREVMGAYPSRDFAGTFFFWGYAFAAGPQRIFGFTTYHGLEEGQLHLIRSHGLDRQALKEALRRRSTWDGLDFFMSNPERFRHDLAEGKHQDHSLIKAVYSMQKVGILTGDHPPSLAVPIFNEDDQEAIHELCQNTSRIIAAHFKSQLPELESLINRCSFAGCSRPDVLCMLFHLAYSYAADRLVEKGVLADFPNSAGGEWGVWIS
jgi:hypothetical protein